MKPAIISVFVASVLPIFFVAIAKFLSGFKMRDNHDPRRVLANAQGKAYFAKCAHDNSWEAFAPFAAAVILAMITGANPSNINKLALTFISFRFLYGFAYIFDKATLRSILWAVGWASTIGLYYLAFTA